MTNEEILGKQSVTSQPVVVGAIVPRGTLLERWEAHRKAVEDEMNLLIQAGSDPKGLSGWRAVKGLRR